MAAPCNPPPTGTTHNDYYKLTMAPVISWVEAHIGHRVTVTFSIDVRDVNLAQRLQVHSTTFLLPPLHGSVARRGALSRAAACSPHLLQRNNNGIVNDIINALHKLSERKFHPDIVSSSAPILERPLNFSAGPRCRGGQAHRRILA